MSDTLKNLAATARALANAIDELQRHPEGAKAFDAWCEDYDFRGEFEARWKDVGDETAQLMVLNGTSFGTYKDDCGYPELIGMLYIESRYSTYVWSNGSWVSEDDLMDELEENVTEKV
jgi:hypothetical protein